MGDKKERENRNYRIFVILITLTIVLTALFNINNLSFIKIFLLLLMAAVFFIAHMYMFFSSKIKLSNVKEIRMHNWISYILISVVIWYIGGLSSSSYHVFHSFIIIYSVTRLGRKDGIFFFLVSNGFFIVLLLTGQIEFQFYLTYPYITITALLLGFFVEGHYKKSQLLDKKVREFESLYKISKIIDTFPSTQVILDNIAEIVAKTLDIDECLIMLYDEEEQVLKSRARYGSVNPKIEDVVFKMGEGISGKVLETKESVISSNLLLDKEIANDFKYDFGLKSCAIVPLVHKDKGIGVIAVYSLEPYDFTSDTIELIDIIASRIVSILENDRLYKDVKESSITDGLTKLYNHRHFYDILDSIIDEAREKEYQVYLLMLDIDKFKRLNDTYGHLLGDKVLREISNIIKENIRRTDIAARYGGEEFAIILPNTNRKNAIKVAQRIKDKIEELSNKIDELKESDITLTVSIGIACYPYCAKTSKDLVERADIRMYLGKRSGGNKIVFIGMPTYISS